MNELLANPAIQTAIVTVVVVLLNVLVAWIKKTFPTQAASVESNWCYLQPAVEAAIAAAQSAVNRGTANGGVPSIIIAQAIAQFADSYRKLEGKDATAAEVLAARGEITTAVNRVTGG